MRPTPYPLLPLLVALLLAAPTSSPASPAPSEDGEAVDETPTPPSLRFDDTLVVSAQRRPLPEGEVGSSVTVIDREEIETRHETTLLELLRTAPGVAVTQAGGPGRAASVFIRGANSQHTLVLVDGLRVNSLQDGGFDFSALAADNIERIEILRGPQSTLYGSEALGGVISITTRRGGGQPTRHVDARAGELGTYRLELGARGSRGAFDYAVTASGFETEGVSAASPRLGNRETDPYERRSLSGHLGWSGDDGGADLTFRLSDGETGLDGFAFGTGPVDDPNFRQLSELGQVALTLERRLTDRWSGRLTLGTVRNEVEGLDPDTPFNNFLFEDRIDQASVESELELGRAGDLTAGYELERRQAESRGGFDESADLSSLFVNHRWSSSDRLHLSAGVRHDDYEGVDEATTWRLTGSYLAAGDRVRIHGSYGTAFRVPSFVELHFPDAGNPALAPEKSSGVDLGVGAFLAAGRLHVDLTWFRSRFDELILFDLTTFRFANVAAADSRGLEATVEATPGRDLRITATWTYNDTENLATGNALARRPRDRGTLELLYTPPGGWTVSGSLLHVADRVDSDGAPMDDYERLDLSVEAPSWRGISPYLRIDNLLDEGYEEVRGFTTPGRLAVVGVRAEF